MEGWMEPLGQKEGTETGVTSTLLFPRRAAFRAEGIFPPGITVGRKIFSLNNIFPLLLH